MRSSLVAAITVVVLALTSTVARAADGESPTLRSLLDGSTNGISSNPGAVNVLTGTGLIGRLIGFGPDSGVRLGGMWLGDANYLFAGGNDGRTWSFNSLLMIELSLDMEKLFKIPGGEFGIEFLQFNGQPTNDQAGAVIGYNSLPGPAPLNRTELFELWWRQRLFDDKLTLRIGKVAPTNDFNNVLRPLPVPEASFAIPSVSGLIYKPVFVNPTVLTAMPGYYNSAYGITATFAPTKELYVSAGVYDGNLARGEQTGLNTSPQFNGHYFTIGEVGGGWRLGPDRLPGAIGIGGWAQTGTLSAGGVQEDGAHGVYVFGSQRLWARHPGVDNSGTSAFAQIGWNDSQTMLADGYVGGGVTAFGLVPRRPKDSMGAGAGVSWLNERLGFRAHEVLLSAYYQAHLIGDIYLEPVITYIPNPGQSRTLSPATAVTTRLLILF